MPKQVTYGVSGLIDWNALIPIGKARMSVHFTGGALTKYGVTPAEYTTTDPITQRLIESSEYFRKGKISILRSVGKADVLPTTQKHGIEAQKAYEGATLPFDSQPSIQTIDVSCLEDAIEYMREHHGIPSVRIRNRETLTNIAAQHGIRFNLPN